MTAWRGHRGLDTKNTKQLRASPDPTANVTRAMRASPAPAYDMCIVCTLARGEDAHVYY